MKLLPRADQADYARLLRAHDVGLALMYTPHPSLVPLEMASAGMVTVTNSFENKTADAMSAISSNLVTVAPTVDGDRRRAARGRRARPRRACANRRRSRELEHRLVGLVPGRARRPDRGGR